MSIQTDTIAAVATPAGPGAIGILRLSGPRAADIAAAVFRPLGKKGLLDRPVRTLVYGDLLDREGQVIDRVLCTYSRGPESYTGEDTAELHCHGSPMVLTLGLEALFAQGARQAGPGEFTQRAFLNGRLDLAQAEAVADLLDAQSREGARHAAGQLSGALSRRVGEIYSALVDLMAHFHAVLDYPDEDIDPFTQEQLARDLTRQETALERLLATYRRGRQLSRGVRCAIVGRPNAGKSSLLNALVGYDRAIVTDIPGTTRDIVEETVNLGDVVLRLADTAGIRDTENLVERIGVDIALGRLQKAELAIAVFDLSEPLSAEDGRILQELSEREIPTVAVLNKNDLPPVWDPSVISARFPHTLTLSAGGSEADQESALSALNREIASLLSLSGFDPNEAMLANERQRACAAEAAELLSDVCGTIEAGYTLDAVDVALESALSALFRLTGEKVSDRVVDEVDRKSVV